MTHPVVSTPRQADFLAIPETPFVYWLRPRFFELLKSDLRLRDVADVRQGLATADNDHFTRCFWEVSSVGTGRNRRDDRWFPYAKGGRYQKWYGLEWLVVDWEEDGKRIRNFSDSVSGRILSRPRSTSYYFRRGLTYSPMGRGSLGLRVLDGSIFDVKGASLFITRDDVPRSAIAAMHSSRVASHLLRVATQYGEMHVGYVSSLPLTLNRLPELEKSGRTCIRLKSAYVVADPTERRFSLIDMERDLHASIRDCGSSQLAFQALLLSCEAIAERITVDAFDITEGDLQALIDETGAPAGWHPLIAGYDAIPSPPDAITLEMDLASQLQHYEQHVLTVDEIVRLKARLRALYQAGQGASLADNAEEAAEAGGDDEDNSNEDVMLGARIPIPAETFLEELSQKLEIHPISIYWLLREMREQEGLVSPPELKRHLEDYASVTVLRQLGYRWPEQDAYERGHGPVMDPSLVDEDGIIPLVPCGDQPTTAQRIRLRLERDFGEEGADQSEREFRQWVGRDLGDWLRREFFKRHVQQFKQRPIAWHFVSPERTFEVFVLYHKLSRATLQKLRAQYAGGLIARLRAEQERARQAGKIAEVSSLQFKIEDVEEFRTRLEKIERGDELQYRIRCRWKGEAEDGRPGPHDFDIDDGVKVNIRPFQEAGLLAVKEVIKKW